MWPIGLKAIKAVGRTITWPSCHRAQIFSANHATVPIQIYTITAFAVIYVDEGEIETDRQTDRKRQRE